MHQTLREIAQLVGGQLHGDADLLISGAATLRDAAPGDVTLAENAAFASYLLDCPASAVLVPAGIVPPNKPYITVANVHHAFGKVVAHFRPQLQPRQTGVSSQATVAESARLERDVVVYPGATIGERVEVGAGTVIHAGVHVLDGCRIGEQVTMFPNVVLYENTVIGPRVLIHAGAVLGAYGFGYETVEGRHKRTAQLGYVEVEADVEIGAGTTIDRGTYGVTRIGEGTKIDNQVMIAHNCRIGRHNIICSQVGIAGSSTTGDYVVIAGQVGIRDHVDIGHRATLGAKAGVMNDIPDNATWFGIPARPESEQKHIFISERKLPEMRKQLKQLQRTLDALVAQQQDRGKQDAA